jgi:CRISPR-associated endonuclease/helicase Cas3
MNFWAHSDPNRLPPTADGAKWQRLRDHLLSVATIAKQFAESAKPEDPQFATEAYRAGLLHDYGKYTQAFQDMILGKRPKGAEHSGHGAWIAAKAGHIPEAFAIAGHHSGLPDGDGGKGSLRERLMRISIEAENIRSRATEDCDDITKTNGVTPTTHAKSTALDLRIRMLFSCLVDADRTDTASSGGEAQISEFPPLDAPTLLAKLLDMARQKAAAVPGGVVKDSRRFVLEACLAAGSDLAQSLFSLTVPTGGAKTIASMAFALKRAAQPASAVRRIIVVIPFLSIIEQNAKVFREAFGEGVILEHHSGYGNTAEGAAEDYTQPTRRSAMENWDAPIIVTTSVRFFESLFSNKPSDLRRVHNLARSVVIFDEVQTFERRYLAAILDVIQCLAKEWSTTFLFCTATQPAFEYTTIADGPRWQPGTIREIMPDPPALFSVLKRVQYDFQIQQPTPWTEIAARLVSAGRGLCIVNTRKHALELYSAVKAIDGVPRANCIHLSTYMCAAHRLEKLASIREMLDAKDRPCIVVSTQLVEAGVDLDFPVVFRAMAPLDSIVQAGGRCDRSGILTAKLGRPAGLVTIFKPENSSMPPGYYEEATSRTENLFRLGMDMDDPYLFKKYFDYLYSDAVLGAEIQQHRLKQLFKTVATEFHWIDDYKQSVIVPFNNEATSLIEELETTFGSKLSVWRKLQRYTVGLSPSELAKGRLGALAQVSDDTWRCIDGFYHEDVGIRLSPDFTEFTI